MRMTIALMTALMTISWAACGSCPPPAAGAPPTVAVTAADTDDSRLIIEATERAAKAGCACATAACAESEATDLARLLRTNPARAGSGVSAKRALIAMEKLLLCRDALAYPEEPVDLDAPSGDAGAAGAGSGEAAAGSEPSGG